MHRLYACLGSGNCLKPWLAMKQTATSFDLTLVDVLSGEQKSPEYLAINPLGVVPYFVTSDGLGIGESNAITWYVAEGTDLMPETPEGRAAALQWMYFEQSKLEPFISPARFFTTILPDMQEERADDIANWQAAARPGLAVLDAHLQRNQFALGQSYSVADIALFGYVHVLEEAGLDPSEVPHIMRWVGDVSSTKSFAPLSDLGRKVDAAA